ncbi:MAG TPA: hypothetical protein PKM21_12310 [Anaerolineales bacterium]|nr:hypothetical protein [Anaerolineales bacterium]
MSTSEEQPRPGIRQRLSKVVSDGKAYYQRSPRLQRFTWQGKVGPAFLWTASILSLVVNLILIVVLVVVVRYVFTLRTMIQDGLINGLYENFVLMDEANITTTVEVATTIQVIDTIPVVFDLPLNQDTEVVLVDATPINGATIYLNGVAVPLDLVLPADTTLGITLDLVVPVSQTVPVSLDVPVNLSVPVDIPLQNTELHQPFTGLQGVVSPYRDLLSNVPQSWEEIGLCKPALTHWFCDLLFAD